MDVNFSEFTLNAADYTAFALFFLGMAFAGYWFGRNERESSEDYFLAGKTLPWYVVGGSFVASNISSDHFIGMVGSAMIFGASVVLFEWSNVFVFSLLIWVFIPFLLTSKVFTTPEFLERRFSPTLRSLFAAVTVISNVVAFLAAVMYGGGLAIQSLFGWSLWTSVIVVGLAAGVWAIYGGLSSVAWTDTLILVVMLTGGIVVTVLGLQHLTGDDGAWYEGLVKMIEINRATEGKWEQANAAVAANALGENSYNRLSVIQPATHPLVPFISLPIFLLSISLWYNVLNQFMIQRVLGAKNMYHARMGIVMAGWVKIFIPLITVVPGMVMFSLAPDLLLGPWEEVRPNADRAYVTLLTTIVPAGFRGLFLAALFGAIQSTVNSVLNSTATVFTLDIYKRHLAPAATDRDLVRIGMISTGVVLIVSIVLGRYVGDLGGSLFEYVQSLYAFFAPPFAAAFLLGILWRRINEWGALAAVVVGFATGLSIKLIVGLYPSHPRWLEPFSNQAAINWIVCVVVCVAVSLLTREPRPEQVTDDLTLNWKRLNVFDGLGSHWYSSVVTWWALFVVTVIGLMVLFSDLVFSVSP